MASVKTKFAVGLFVTAGLAFATLAVVWLGMSHYLEKGRFFAVYFDESVQGLDKDSPVKYRGVSIGRVHAVEVAPDVRLIEVVLKVDPVLEKTEEMVAALKSVGITGIMYVELDQRTPGDEVRMPGLTFPSKYPVIATRPSEIQRLFTSVESLVTQVAKLNLGDISTKIELTLDGINNSLKTLSLGPLSSSVTASAKSLEKILDEKKWDRLMSSITSAGDQVSGLSGQASGALSRLETAMNQNGPALRQSMAGLESAIEDLSKLIGRLSQTTGHADALLDSGDRFLHRTDSRIEDLERSLSVSLGNLESATDKLNRFLDTIALQPSQVIFGAPAKDRGENEP